MRSATRAITEPVKVRDLGDVAPFKPLVAIDRLDELLVERESIARLTSSGPSPISSR